MQSGDENHDLLPARVKWHASRGALSDLEPLPAPREKQARKSTYHAARVAGPGRMCFCRRASPQECLGLRTSSGKARFIEGLPQLSGPVHSFCTNHFDFRFIFAMLV